MHDSIEFFKRQCAGRPQGLRITKTVESATEWHPGKGQTRLFHYLLFSSLLIPFQGTFLDRWSLGTSAIREPFTTEAGRAQRVVFFLFSCPKAVLYALCASVVDPSF